MTHICRATVISQVPANIMGNFCQQVKYLEIRDIVYCQIRAILMHVLFGIRCWTKPCVELMRVIVRSNRGRGILQPSPHPREWQALCWEPTLSGAQITAFTLTVPRLLQFLLHSSKSLSCSLLFLKVGHSLVLAFQFLGNVYCLPSSCFAAQAKENERASPLRSWNE